MLRRLAVSRLHFPNGTVLFNQVLEFRQKKVIAIYALTEELPYTEWMGGDYYLLETPSHIK